MDFTRFSFFIIFALAPHLSIAATTFDLSATCGGGCSGLLEGTLEVTDEYVFGSSISSGNVITFTLDTSLGSRTYRGSDLVIGIGGLDETGASSSSPPIFLIAFNNLDGIQLFPDNSWNGRVNGIEIYGTDASWALREVPLPASGVLFFSSLSILVFRFKHSGKTFPV